MSEISNYDAEYERSLDVYTDPIAYGRFDLTKDLKRISGCIDPRPEDIDVMKVTEQTTGGAVGYAHDAGLVWIAEDGLPSQRDLGGDSILVAGLQRDRRARQIAVVIDAHRRCKFDEAVEVVLAEEADPSDFTLETLERWTRQYAVHGYAESNNKRIMEAAGRQLDHIREFGSGDVVGAADELHPDHPNIHDVIGENNARIHIVNHHPHAGLRREWVHRPEDGRGVVVQAYHDSLGATANDINRLAVAPDTRGLYAGALMVRAAASRTVLGSLNQDTTYIEIFPADNESGLHFDLQTK